MHTTNPKPLIQQALEILEAIRNNYPEGDFDREMLHGDMDFRYKKIHELRRRLDDLPEAVRRFAVCVEALPVDKDVLLKLMRWLQEKPGTFSQVAAGGSQAVRDRAAAVAQAMGVRSCDLQQVLFRLRLAGILTGTYELSEVYRPVASDFVGLAEPREGESGYQER
ncbi:hypothetical protein SAMN02746041_01891 [Desulfacinum hydrothermale DSM 13146]|uniref:Uncharacterized protein n=1 Tax=Desulfacinum hydrothermale DSM 13146 TaxID=1121390 RepID=A0A1W1XJ50_9BACT|nr:hypothetical protein [Desulfacinum hydrothermale]SMC23989.1 hypothetical protein SAMN02746041_01891 [Desulfacinum hydrothermale DSM 13146]